VNIVTPKEMFKNLSAMRDSLSTYQSFLELQRAQTIKQQFREFTESMGIEANPQQIESLYESFDAIVSSLDEDTELTLQDKILNTLESPFIIQILSLKTAARESEMRRMTQHLSEFIRKVPATGDDSQFLHDLLATSLDTLADQAEFQRDHGSSDTYNEAWLSNLREQAEKLFKR
jgi:hypothetical protein